MLRRSQKATDRRTQRETRVRRMEKAHGRKDQKEMMYALSRMKQAERSNERKTRKPAAPAATSQRRRLAVSASVLRISPTLVLTVEPSTNSRLVRLDAASLTLWRSAVVILDFGGQKLLVLASKV